MNEMKPPIDPVKAGLVFTLLQKASPGNEVQSTYDFDRSAQFYRVATSGGLHHRVYVSKEFFDDHTVSEVQSLLHRWKMLQMVERAGARAVIVTNGGIEVPGMHLPILSDPTISQT